MKLGLTGLRAKSAIGKEGLERQGTELTSRIAEYVLTWSTKGICNQVWQLLAL
jgi:hypothetical protein